MDPPNTQLSKTLPSRGVLFRKWMRVIHRDLGYVFAGMLLVYAVSGIFLNHKNTFNSQYSIERTELNLTPLSRSDLSRERVDGLLDEAMPDGSLKSAYIQHYCPDSTTLKVFLKANSSLVVNLSTGQALLEQVHKRPVIGSLSRLHYNPNRAWTWFSDIFAVALIVIILTGLFMLNGKHGLWGIGGIELLVGILIPLLFALLG